MAKNVNFLIGNASSPNLRSHTLGITIEEDATYTDDPSEGLISRNADIDTYDEPVSDVRNKQMIVEVFHPNNLGERKDDSHWVEKSRFVHYEEDCEGYDNHFGKPHVPIIPMEDFNHLLQLTKKAILLNDVVYSNFSNLVELVTEMVVDAELPGIGNAVREILEDRQKEHQVNAVLKLTRESSTRSIKLSARDEPHFRNIMSVPTNLGGMAHYPTKKVSLALSQLKGSFLGTPFFGIQNDWENEMETAIVIAGSVPDMTKCRLVLINFDAPSVIPEFSNNINGVRQMFFLIGPKVQDLHFVDVARALGSVLSNPVFGAIFEKVRSAQDITSAIETYLSDTVVIAPGRIDSASLVPGDRIRKIVNQRAEKHQAVLRQAIKDRSKHPMSVKPQENLPKKGGDEPKKWSLFSGMIDDIKNRKKFYWSDWTDGFDKKTIFTVVFMFFACLAPTLTFGGLMNIYTRGAMGIWESLAAQAVSGIIMSLFAAQPLVIMSLTGPFLIFEAALFQICEAFTLRFMVVRFWSGAFIFLYSIVVTAFNGARLLKYVTVFTEDIFSLLISLIFVSEGFGYIRKEWDLNPVESYDYYEAERIKCNSTMTDPCVLSQPNTFLLNLFFMLTTFGIAFQLRQLSRSQWFGRNIRAICGDFGVLVALMAVTFSKSILFNNVTIGNLDIPRVVDFSNRYARGHGLMIYPGFQGIVTIPVAAGAGALVFILLFVEVEITEQMLSRKERKLKKGSGMHWDLVLVGFTIFVCSAFGLPWMCAAAVQSLAHATSLTILRKKAPGESPKPVAVIEQRVTNLLISVFMGVYAELGSYVHIPTACFFGVFFYLAVMNLHGNQFIKRLKMFFLPAKYRGPASYLDIIPFKRVVFYTLLQLALIIAIFLIKMFKSVSLLFPLVLCSYIIGRHFLLPYVFTELELDALDGEPGDEPSTETEEKATDMYYNTRIPV